MIASEFYIGQGLGNQLWVYAVVRTLAEKNGFDFAFLSPQNFKFPELNLDMGKKVPWRQNGIPNSSLSNLFSNYLREERYVNPVGVDISPMDARLLKLADSTKLDGYFQAEDLIHDNINQIREWFKVPKIMNLDENVCVISFRGGEYLHHHQTFLGFHYYQNAMRLIKEVCPNVKFVVSTDDPEAAEVLIPNAEILSTPTRSYLDIDQTKVAFDFALLQNANFLILSNSSFSWWGAWTNSVVKKVIAPKYWGNFVANNGYWSQGESLTRGWTWLDKSGSDFTYDECKIEFTKFKHSEKYSRIKLI